MFVVSYIWFQVFRTAVHGKKDRRRNKKNCNMWQEKERKMQVPFRSCCLQMYDKEL